MRSSLIFLAVGVQFVDVSPIAANGWRDSHQMLIDLHVDIRLFQPGKDRVGILYDEADNRRLRIRGRGGRVAKPRKFLL
jgi:hypothetical protein